MLFKLSFRSEFLRPTIQAIWFPSKILGINQVKNNSIEIQNPGKL